MKTPMIPTNNLGPNLAGKSVNETSYRGMIRSLIYLTATRPDIQFSTVLCARYQSNLRESHLIAVKRILKYLKGTPTLSLYYLKCLGFDLKGYSDLDYAGYNMDRKSTSGACQILGGKLVCSSAKKQQPVAMSSTKAEYVVVVGCCASILWMKVNSVTMTFIIRWDHILKGDIELHFIPTEYQLADIFTKPLDEPTFTRLKAERTTLSPHQIGSWEQSNIKGAFKKDVIPFSENLKETFKLFEKGFIVKVKEMKDIFEQMEDEVDQCSMAKKCFEIEKKQLLINNDQLLEENITGDIMCTYLRSLNEVDNCGKCKSLDIVLLDLQESNKSLCELRKRFAKLEEYNITLDIAFQNHKEQMNLNNPKTKNK
ncbi:hypothetical protein Tco_0551520 [Tanacetum coccineum]